MDGQKEKHIDLGPEKQMLKHLGGKFHHPHHPMVSHCLQKSQIILLRIQALPIMTPIVLISSSAGSPTTGHLGALVLPKHVQLLPPTEFCSSYLNTIGLRIDSQTLRKDSVQVFCGDRVWEMITKIPGAQIPGAGKKGNR